jgi:Lar family restriction alleviation protein
MEPLPCPFCGEEPVVDNSLLKGARVWSVACENDDCPVDVETADFESIDDAIKAWNQRVG